MQDADPDALSRIGEVLLVAGGGVDVLWADGSRSTAQPAQLFVVSGDDEDMGGPVSIVVVTNLLDGITKLVCAAAAAV